MVGDFERLAQEFVHPEAILQFRVCGEQDARGRSRLRCKVSANLDVECQRCLKPVAVSIDSERVLYLASSEEEADRLETVLAASDATGALEVIVADKTLDLTAVVEDEVLLGLPLVSVHDECAHEFSQLAQAE